ncbi:MAG: hypothetical protein K0S55_1720, partial [Clostridia bacterium]|nr:hypothetical protein [Clostridia bacterium]
MKKILSFIIFIVIIMSLIACNNTAIKSEDTETSTDISNEMPLEEPPSETPKDEYISKLLPIDEDPAGEVVDLPMMTLNENDVLSIKDG